MGRLLREKGVGWDIHSKTPFNCISALPSLSRLGGCGGGGTKKSNPIWRVTGFSNTNQSTVGQTEERGHPHTQKEQGTKAGRGGTLGALSTAEPPSSVRGRGRRGTRRWEPTSAAAQPSDSGLSAGESGGWGIAEAGLEKVRGPVRRPAVDQAAGARRKGQICKIFWSWNQGFTTSWI